MNAIDFITQDHERVRKLLREYATAELPSEKRIAAEQVLSELAIHGRLEQEIFYPALRQRSGTSVEQAAEGYDEHRQVDNLIDELKGMNPDDDRFEERFQALIGAVEYHFAQEQAEILPAAARTLGDELERLGREMVERKKRLIEEFA